MLKTEFIPVAIDQAYQRRQKDTEGEFYRKIARQGPRSNFNSTTQGFYIATPGGKLLLYNNNRHPEKVRRLMEQRLAEFKAGPPEKNVRAIKAEKHDPRYAVRPPAGGLVVRVNAKVLGGYEPTDNRWQRIFQSALSRDNLWITKAEHRALAAGELPRLVQERIARFHLVDNTRGEPPMWRREEIRKLDMKLRDDGVITGTVHLETKSGDRGYQAELLGVVETDGGAVTRFDMVARGKFWGAGRYTLKPPPGKFPLAVAFTLADGSQAADRVPPQGSRGWLPGYLK